MLASLKLGIVVSLCALAASASDPGPAQRKPRLKSGDGVTLLLKEGREVSGVYKGEKEGAIWLGVDDGEVGIERALVLEIKKSANDDGEFARRRAALAPDDLEGHWKLAEWASHKGLDNSARSEAAEVVKLNPEHVQARALLGHEKIEGLWMPYDEAMEAKGLIAYKGTWITKAQYTQLEQERNEEARRAASASGSSQSRSSYGSQSSCSQRSGYSETIVFLRKGRLGR